MLRVQIRSELFTGLKVNLQVVASSLPCALVVHVHDAGILEPVLTAVLREILGATAHIARGEDTDVPLSAFDFLFEFVNEVLRRVVGFGVSLCLFCVNHNALN